MDLSDGVLSTDVMEVHIPEDQIPEIIEQIFFIGLRMFCVSRYRKQRSKDMLSDEHKRTCDP